MTHELYETGNRLDKQPPHRSSPNTSLGYTRNRTRAEKANMLKQVNDSAHGKAQNLILVIVDKHHHFEV